MYRRNFEKWLRSDLLAFAAGIRYTIYIANEEWQEIDKKYCVCA